eukprot:3885531-Karenia_brevis.AAC.1
MKGEADKSTPQGEQGSGKVDKGHTSPEGAAAEAEASIREGKRKLTEMQSAGESAGSKAEARRIQGVGPPPQGNIRHGLQASRVGCS